uniref:type II secretion system F family protein n=1 Tax=Microbacterium sp. TaxID=51671 RepID=UPI0035C8124E
MSTSTAQAFDYVGRDATGRKRRGTVDAPSKAVAMARVREMGITVTSVTESSILTREIDFSLFQKKIGLREVSLAIRQISTMIDAGLTLVRGLSIIVGQLDNTRLRDVFTTVLRDIERG